MERDETKIKDILTHLSDLLAWEKEYAIMIEMIERYKHTKTETYKNRNKTETYKNRNKTETDKNRNGNRQKQERKQAETDRRRRSRTEENTNGTDFFAGG